MSRYYSITITNPDTGEVVRPRSFAGLKLPESYTSYVNGKSLPGALNIELNVPLYNYATPRQGAFVRIWGVSNEELSQGNDLNNFDIVIKAGMQKGLPLAKPAQAGVIVQGKIFQAFGNAIGTDRTLDIIMQPSVGTVTKRANFSFSWPANTPMSEAIEATLRVALPGYEIKMAISADLKKNAPETMVLRTLGDFSTAIFKLSQASQFKGIKPLSGGPYPGVNITIREKRVLVYDGTADYGAPTFSNPKKILFEDLIGQPTWIAPTVINFKCAMRADIGVGDYIQMPAKPAVPYGIITPGAAIPGTPARNTSLFKGIFVPQNMQHFGNFRQADAASWVTSYDAVFAPPPAQAIEAANQAKIAAAFNA